MIFEDQRNDAWTRKGRKEGKEKRWWKIARSKIPRAVLNITAILYTASLSGFSWTKSRWRCKNGKVRDWRRLVVERISSWIRSFNVGIILFLNKRVNICIVYHREVGIIQFFEFLIVYLTDNISHVWFIIKWRRIIAKRII